MQACQQMCEVLIEAGTGTGKSLAYLLPSLLYAVQNGTPVVVSNRTGVAASFADGEALVVPYDPDATVDAVERVLTDPQLRARLSEGALRAAARSTWDEVAAQQLAIYREAIGRLRS